MLFILFSLGASFHLYTGSGRTRPSVCVSTMSTNDGALVTKKALSALIAVSLGLTALTNGGVGLSTPVAHAQEMQSIFVGQYKDPNHPEGSRVITAKVVSHITASGLRIANIILILSPPPAYLPGQDRYHHGLR